MLVSGRFAAFLVCLSDTARDGQTPAGMAGLRHKQRHKQRHKLRTSLCPSAGCGRADPHGVSKLLSGQVMRNLGPRIWLNLLQFAFHCSFRRSGVAALTGATPSKPAAATVSATVCRVVAGSACSHQRLQSAAHPTPKKCFSAEHIREGRTKIFRNFLAMSASSATDGEVTDQLTVILPAILGSLHPTHLCGRKAHLCGRKVHLCG